MPTTIWKFTLAPTDDQKIDMPEGAKVLTAREQRGEVCVWAEVDPGAPMGKRRFRIFGTGHPIPYVARTYVGTAVLHGGALVLHVYEGA